MRGTGPCHVMKPAMSTLESETISGGCVQSVANQIDRQRRQPLVGDGDHSVIWHAQR